MRLVDADKLREEWLENGENEYVYDTNAVLESIDNQPTIEPYGTWIPCRERLPEYGRYFKVWASFSNQYASYTKRIHWDYDRFVWNNGREVKEMPDAWMPYFSPLPYREEKKDE